AASSTSPRRRMSPQSTPRWSPACSRRIASGPRGCARAPPPEAPPPRRRWSVRGGAPPDPEPQRRADRPRTQLVLGPHVGPAGAGADAVLGEVQVQVPARGGGQRIVVRHLQLVRRPGGEGEARPPLQG